MDFGERFMCDPRGRPGRALDTPPSSTLWAEFAIFPFSVHSAGRCSLTTLLCPLLLLLPGVSAPPPPAPFLQLPFLLAAGGIFLKQI